MTDLRPYRPADIALPEGWTWERIEESRARYGTPDTMVPIAAAPGVVAWGTINSVRMIRDAKAAGTMS